MLPSEDQEKMHPHQWTAQSLLNIAPALMQVFQDQWAYLQDINAENMLQICHSPQHISIANGLFVIEFDEEVLIRLSKPNKELSFEKISQFILKHIPFFTGHQVAQHPTTVKTNVQLLRQTLIEQIFEWVDAENRIEQFLYTISQQDAHAIDHLLMQQNYYDQAYLTKFVEIGQTIPLEVELNLKHLCLANSVQGEQFISVQALIPHYEKFCFSAQRFMPKAIYDLVRCFYPEQFHLVDLLNKKTDFSLLMQHAQEKPHMLPFAKLMHRGYWQYQNLLDKKQFLDAKSVYWDESLLARRPVFYQTKTVNWLFKQSFELNLWISQSIQSPNLRVAITALSLVDCSYVHPHVILMTLKYFQNIAARLLLADCHALAIQQHWFLQAENTQYRLNGHTEHLEQKMVISSSMLYIEEWLALLHILSQKNQKIIKQSYLKLSRAMQAYMIFLHQTVQNIPSELYEFIEPSAQQHDDFFKILKQYQISVSDFRQHFKHYIPHQNRSMSIFDSYVADYLLEHFSQQKVLNKNMTWQGLFQHAYEWHQQLEFDVALTHLKYKVNIEEWERLSPEAVIYFEEWYFEELHQLQRVIQESVDYKHCLAHVYAERMSVYEYVAFHVYAEQNPEQCLTLGCLYQNGQLQFDQLKYPSNRAADEACLNKVYAFIAEFNLTLRKKAADARIFA